MNLEQISDGLVFSRNTLGFPQIKHPAFGFTVALDLDGSSADAINAIWRGQHQCVSERYAGAERAPDNAEEIVIKHQLKGDRGHYSVLDQSFFVMSVDGAPHEAIAQLTRHHESKFLVQSGRYSGHRYLKVANGALSPEECFYHDPLGHYQDRDGSRFTVTKDILEIYFHHCFRACEHYKELVVHKGYSFETARSWLPYGFRQCFQISGRYRDWWHLLDQRLKADAQLSTRVLSLMFHELLLGQVPGLQQWYADNRRGKARLAP